MRYSKWIGFAAAALLVVACFLPWVYIESRGITVSGVRAGGTNYGKPGYFHFVLVLCFTIFNFLPSIWAKRSNLLITALNTGWALRNFFVITACAGGDCPEKKAGIYLLLITSLLMLLASLFPDIKLPAEKKTTSN